MKLNKILSGFNKTLKQLDVFIKQQENNITKNARAKAQLEQDRVVFQQDRDLALKAKKNIEGIIS